MCGVNAHLRMQPARRAHTDDIDTFVFKQIPIILIWFSSILFCKPLGTRPDDICDGNEARLRQLADRLRMARRNPATADQAKCNKISPRHTATSLFNAVV